MILRSLLVVLLVAVALHTFAQSDAREASPYSTERTNDSFSADIQLFPNPAPDYVHIRLGALKSKDVRISVLNVIGSELTPEVETIDEHEMRVRVKDLAPGYYFLALKDEATKYKGVFKFLKR